jgi:hypothetical protein
MENKKRGSSSNLKDEKKKKPTMEEDEEQAVRQVRRMGKRLWSMHEYDSYSPSLPELFDSFLNALSFELIAKSKKKDTLDTWDDVLRECTYCYEDDEATKARVKTLMQMIDDRYDELFPQKNVPFITVRVE